MMQAFVIEMEVEEKVRKSQIEEAIAEKISPWYMTVKQI